MSNLPVLYVPPVAPPPPEDRPPRRRRSRLLLIAAAIVAIPIVAVAVMGKTTTPPPSAPVASGPVTGGGAQPYIVGEATTTPAPATGAATPTATEAAAPAAAEAVTPTTAAAATSAVSEPQAAPAATPEAAASPSEPAAAVTEASPAAAVTEASPADDGVRVIDLSKPVRADGAIVPGPARAPAVADLPEKLPVARPDDVAHTAPSATPPAAPVTAGVPTPASTARVVSAPAAAPNPNVATATPEAAAPLRTVDPSRVSVAPAAPAAAPLDHTLPRAAARKPAPVAETADKPAPRRDTATAPQPLPVPEPRRFARAPGEDPQDFADRLSRLRRAERPRPSDDALDDGWDDRAWVPPAPLTDDGDAVVVISPRHRSTPQPIYRYEEDTPPVLRPFAPPPRMVRRDEPLRENCHYHAYPAEDMAFHRDVRCHWHRDPEDRSLRYVR